MIHGIGTPNDDVIPPTTVEEEDVYGDLPTLLTLKEFARLFRRSPRTVREWVAEGRVKIDKIGRGKFVKRDEVLRLLEGG